MIDIKQLEQQIKQRKNCTTTNSSIGSTIKYKRKEMNMTLEESASGICSVSYLSKVENNQIEPTKDMILPLLERFALDISMEESQDFEHTLENAISQIFAGEKISNEKHRVNNYQDCLLSVLVQTTNNVVEKVVELFQNIRNDIKQLTDYELLCLIYGIQVVFQTTGQYLDGYKSIKMIEELLTNDKISILITMIKLNYEIKMNKKSEIHTNSEKLLMVLLEQQHYGYIDEVKRSLLINEAKISQPYIFHEKMELLNNITQIEKNTLKALNYYCFEQLNKSFQLLVNQPNSEENFILRLLIADEQKNFNEINKILIDIDIPLKTIEFSYIKDYLKLKYNLDEHSKINFFITQLQNVKEIPKSHFLLMYLVREGCETFKAANMYKEATLWLEQLMKIIVLLTKN